jgi:CspA family cold shock protein
MAAVSWIGITAIFCGILSSILGVFLWELIKSQRRAVRLTGKVNWWNDKKGYGMITPDNGIPDIFVHYKFIQGEGFRTLSEKQRVSFEIVKTGKGPRAENVVKLE